MINFPCEKCQAQLTFEDKLGGSPGLCPQCKEMIYIPKQADSSKGIRVARTSFSPFLQKLVDTKVSDIDDDPTDNKFLVAKEIRQSQSEAAQKLMKKRLEDIDDDLTDNKYLDAPSKKVGQLSESQKKFLKKDKP